MAKSRIPRRIFQPRQTGKNKFSKGRIAAASAAVAVVLLVALLGTGVLQVPFLTNAIGSVFTPVQRTVHTWITDIKSWSTQRQYSKNLETAYNQLLSQYSTLSGELDQMTELQEENSRLQKLLGYAQENSEKSFTLAYVSGMEPSQWFCEFTINRGSADGIEKDAPVYTADGLIGRVTETGDHFATVMSIVDSRSAVSCIVKRTRDNGVVKGNAGTLQDGLCRMLYLPVASDVAIGDEIYTSGLDGIYPEGLFVGTVSGLSREDSSENPYVLVDVQADFTHIEEVLVQVNAQ